MRQGFSGIARAWGVVTGNVQGSVPPTHPSAFRGAAKLSGPITGCRFQGICSSGRPGRPAALAQGAGALRKGPPSSRSLRATGTSGEANARLTRSVLGTPGWGSSRVNHFPSSSLSTPLQRGAADTEWQGGKVQADSASHLSPVRLSPSWSLPPSAPTRPMALHGEAGSEQSTPLLLRNSSRLCPQLFRG